MVEDRVSDSTRIAELLAAELTGLSRGSLAHVSVVDADRSVTPGADGPVAFRIAVEPPTSAECEDTPSTPIGTVRLFEDAVRVRLEPVESAIVDEQSRHPGVGPDRPRDDLAIEADAPALCVRIRSGAAVKPAVDAIEAAVVDPVAGDGPD